MPKVNEDAVYDQIFNTEMPWLSPWESIKHAVDAYCVLPCPWCKGSGRDLEVVWHNCKKCKGSGRKSR